MQDTPSAGSASMVHFFSHAASINAWPVTAKFLQDLMMNNASMVHDASAELISDLFTAIKMDGSSRDTSLADELSSFDYSSAPDTNYLRKLSSDITGNGSQTSFIVNIVLAFVCIVCAGFASGLMQGLLSLNFTEMTIKSRSGTPEEKKHATKVIPFIKHHHLLLVTLMLWNAAATEALPIFLTGLVPEYLALIISVFLVLIMGNIIPVAILTGESGVLGGNLSINVLFFFSS